MINAVILDIFIAATTGNNTQNKNFLPRSYFTLETSGVANCSVEKRKSFLKP